MSENILQIIPLFLLEKKKKKPASYYGSIKFSFSFLQAKLKSVNLKYYYHKLHYWM